MSRKESADQSNSSKVFCLRCGDSEVQIVRAKYFACSLPPNHCVGKILVLIAPISHPRGAMVLCAHTDLLL